MIRLYGLTGPHRTRSDAVSDWDAANAGPNNHRVQVRRARGWYAFDREAFETDDEAAARLEEYLDAERGDTPEVTCDQCAFAMINRVFCHETGCPNERKAWDGEERRWVRLNQED